MITTIAHHEIVVGMAGTFDVENYGDLLFPLIAGEALRRRDRRIRVWPFSVNRKSAPSWPFQVRSMEEMAASLPTLSAMLIGGGHIVRFDERYPVSVPVDVDMPVAYWLIPAIHAALAGKPVIWNAVAAQTDAPRVPWYDELVRQALVSSYFVGVRDIASRDHLAKLAPEASIELLPDTAFGLSRLWPLEEKSAEFANWRLSLGLEGRYGVIQANPAVGYHRSTIESLAKSMGVDLVILPVSWCHGDRAEEFPKLKGRVFLSREWLGPKLISEIIGRSEFVVASSLHACITAISYGVPGLRVPICSDRKFELLDAFSGIVRIDRKNAVAYLIDRGHGTEPRVTEYADQLDRYWDMVCEIVLQPQMEHCNLSRPLVLCSIAKAREIDGRVGIIRRLAVTLRKLIGHLTSKQRAVIRHRLFLLKAVGVSAFRWAIPTPSAPDAEMESTAEAPAAPRRSLERSAERILKLNRIEQVKIATEPYKWAFIDQLFSIEQAALLSASFPRDKFKRLKGSDGEKGYEYMSRSLIHMGASVPSYPEGLSPTWRALADELLSPEYRSALSRFTGEDLASALLEVNVLHYGPGSWLGPHLDLTEKMITHVLYFNETWDAENGGCLNILRSADQTDVVAEILPVVGNSVLLVRSNRSWHSVSPVVRDCRTSRCSVNVIFHLPGSVSTMWPPGTNPVLHDCAAAT